MAKNKSKGNDLLSLDITDLVGAVRSAQPQQETDKHIETKEGGNADGTQTDLWQLFLDSIDFYKEKPFKGTCVWVDEDIMNSVQKMKSGPLKANVKQLVNSMLRAFVVAEMENCKKAKGTPKGMF